MINVYKVRKWAAMLVVGFASVIGYAVGQIIYQSFWWSLGLFAAGLLVSMFMAVLLLKNPFTQLMEGKGLLTITLDSTGIIQPFISSLSLPNVVGNLKGETKKDIWDRNLTYMMGRPIHTMEPATLTPDGRIALPEEIFEKNKLDQQAYSRGRFQLWHYPCLIWNEPLNTFLTKDALSETEKLMFAEHAAYAQNKKLEELDMRLREFTRHIIDLLRPILGVMKSPWFWLIMIMIIGVLGIIFVPDLIATMQGEGNKAMEAAGEVITKR